MMQIFCTFNKICNGSFFLVNAIHVVVIQQPYQIRFHLFRLDVTECVCAYVCVCCLSVSIPYANQLEERKAQHQICCLRLRRNTK